MATKNRAALLTKAHKILKKHYSPAVADANRSMLEHLLYACCLENASPKAADKVFESLVEQFFDWNEVRVSSVRELAEVMQPLSDSQGAARRVKSVLQNVFESVYEFDLESLKKLNIGQAVSKLEKYDGTTRFTVAYVTQAGLGGHSIPVNTGALTGLTTIGVISTAEAEKHVVPGLERAIAKNKGAEFGSLLHQWGVDLRNNPYSPANRKLLLEIAPDCKDRLPKRPTKKRETIEEKPGKPGKAKVTANKKSAAPKASTARKKTKPAKKATPKKKTAAKKQVPVKKKVGAKKKSSSQTERRGTTKKSSTKRLSKRKPR